MRAEAHRYVPEGGKGFWENDAAFFDSGGTEKWRGKVSDEDLALYRAHLTELMPEVAARRWLEIGSPAAGRA
jgi:aryl sulfotransferase